MTWCCLQLAQQPCRRRRCQKVVWQHLDLTVNLANTKVMLLAGECSSRAAASKGERGRLSFGGQRLPVVSEFRYLVQQQRGAGGLAHPPSPPPNTAEPFPSLNLEVWRSTDHLRNHDEKPLAITHDTGGEGAGTALGGATERGRKWEQQVRRENKGMDVRDVHVHARVRISEGWVPGPQAGVPYWCHSLWGESAYGAYGQGGTENGAREYRSC